MAFVATGTLSVKKFNKYTSIDSYMAGAALNEGQAVYLDSSSKWQLAKADAIGTQAVGIAGRTVTSAQATAADDTARVLVHTECEVEGYTGATPGNRVYLSAATGGLVTETAPATATNILQVTGRSLTATRVRHQVRPSIEAVQAAATTTLVNA